MKKMLWFNIGYALVDRDETSWCSIKQKSS